MRILCISTERGWHGGEEQLRLLIDGAIDLGHSCMVAARRGGEFASRMQQHGVAVAELASNVRGPRSIWQLRRAVSQFIPDVIYANDPHGLSLMRMATWPHSRAVRVAARRVVFPIRSAGRYNQCDAVICVSGAIAQVCSDSGVAPHLLRVVYDGVDPRRVGHGDAHRGRQSLEFPNDVPLLLSVAKLVPCKGHRYLIEAMPAVLARNPHAVLVLAGDGPLRGELEELAATLRLSRSIRFLGYRRDVPDLIAACNLFVLASLEEGLGTSILDAQFAKRAVVGANTGGIPELLRNEEGQPCGWLAASHCADSLAAAMLDAIENEEEQQRRIAYGYEHAHRRFTADAMVRRTLSIFSSIVHRQAA